MKKSLILNNEISENTKDEFNLDTYLSAIDKIIVDVLSKPAQDKLTYDILDTKKLKANKMIALKEKQRQMKVGTIMQVVLGNYEKFIDLGTGHESGLDILSKQRHIIIELKN